MKKNKGWKKLNRRDRGWNFRLNDQGAAIVVILIVIALVSVLASMVMYMSYANYVMKANESGSKNNFYSAEAVLDQINSGLQTHVSVAIGAAYDVASQTTTNVNEAQRETNFQNTYVTNLIGLLKKGNSNDQYEVGTIASVTNVTGLYAYLDNNLRVMALNYDYTTDGPFDAEKGYLHIYSETQEMSRDTDGLILKDLVIEFCDDDGYYSEIHTDIRFIFPDISMAAQQSFPDVDTYNIIADGGVEGSAAGSIVLTGNIYAGNSHYPGEGTDPLYGLHISGTTTVNSCGVNGSYSNIIIKGGLNVDQSTLNIEKGNVWTDDMNVHSSTIKVTGDQSAIYNADDLTLTGTGNQITLEGSYVGYGDGRYNYTVSPAGEYDTASLSSAIIVNSKNTTLNMASLKGLYLAGTAYLNPYKNDYFEMNYDVSKFNATEIPEKILIGNSIAVKIDQLAYLLPRACIGVMDGVSIINQNPMTQSEYNMWRAYNTSGKANYLPVDYSKIKDAYGFEIAATSDAYTYQVVAKQTAAGSMYYVYLAFNNEIDSSNYYKSYLANASERLSTYANKYNNRIYLPTTNSTAINTNGNLVSCQLNSNTGNMYYALFDANMGGENNNNMINKQYAQTYETWCSLLSSNRDLTGDREKSVYENTIDESQFSHYSMPGNYTGDGGVRAVVVDGNYNISPGYDSNIKLVIATGNVNVSASFSGLIIAGGHVDIKNGCSISADETNVQKALLAEVDSEHSVASAFFVNGSAYSTANNSASSSVSYTNVKDLIIYENWSKE